MPKGKKLPPKREVAQALLMQGATFVHLDPRAVDVVVPDWLKRQPQLVLHIGLNMPVPIRDLRVDETGVFGTLSFNRAPFTCMVPWHAVFALVGDDRRGMVWPESMPAEIAQEIEREAERAVRAALVEVGEPPDDQPAPARKKRARKAPALRRLQQPSQDGDGDSGSAERSSPKPVSLRLIPGEARDTAVETTEAGEPESVGAPGKRSRRAPHLRLVKS